MRRLALVVLASIVGCGDDVGGAAETSTSTAPQAETTAPGDTSSTPPSTTDAGSSGGEVATESSSGDVSTGPACPGNAAPEAPTIVDPPTGRIDVIAETLSITVSDFVDPDADDTAGALAIEIWTMKDGAIDDRVWSAETNGATTVDLSDGALDPGEVFEPWVDYAIRARWSDAHAECSAWGEWSEPLAFRTDDGSTALFDESVVRDFYLDIPPESWDAINAQAYPPGCVPHVREYHTGTLRFEDQVFEGVGIKIKGGCGSSRDLGGKASFKVNLEWDDPEVAGCPAERRLLGEKSFGFHNGVQDQSASHERLGYAFFRELGIPAPRAASVRIFVNDDLWGLYTHVETIDRRFLSRWFDSKEGMLYEGTYWCDLVPENIGPSDEDDSYCLTREFSPDACSVPDPEGDPIDYAKLHELIGQIEALDGGDFYPAVADFMEFDRFLTTWAIESVLSHWDNYAFHIRNNYRVYHDPSTLHWTLLSTGIDQTFGSDEDPWSVTGVLAVRCLEDPECEAAFAARLAEVNDAFTNSDLVDRADAMFDQLVPFVQEDPRREYNFSTFVDLHDDLGWFIEQRPARIEQYLDAHGF